VKRIPGGLTLAGVQLAIALVMSLTAMAGGTSGALFVGACAVLACFALVWWPAAACMPVIGLVAVALAYGSDNRWIALLEALACGLLAVAMVLLGGIRRGNPRMWRTRGDAASGAVLAALICVAGALVDSSWGWLAVAMPLCLGVVYVGVMLILRRPVQPNDDEPLPATGGAGSLLAAAYTSDRSAP
jgi:hypothetical protein